MVSTPLKNKKSQIGSYWIIILTVLTLGENKTCSKPPTSLIYLFKMEIFHPLRFHEGCLGPSWPRLVDQAEDLRHRQMPRGRVRQILRQRADRPIATVRVNSWLVVLTCFNHLETYEKQWEIYGNMIPHVMENIKNVTNHQSNIVSF